MLTAAGIFYDANSPDLNIPASRSTPVGRFMLLQRIARDWRGAARKGLEGRLGA